MAALLYRDVTAADGSGADGSQRAVKLSILCLAMAVFAGILVVIRFVGRYLKRSIGADDWTILAAFVLAVLYTAIQITCVQHGLGKHTWDVSPEDKVITLRYLYILQVSYKISLSLIKISFLLLFVRIFYVQKLFVWTCYVLMAITTASGIAFTFPTVFQCKPIRAYWDRSVPHKCIENAQWRVSYALLNVITDFFILFLPIRESILLLSGRRDKILVIFIFSLGLFCCVVSIIRTTTIFGTSDNHDPLWSVALISVWSAIELNTGIIVACLPMLRQSFFIIFPRSPSSFETTSYSVEHFPHRIKDYRSSKSGPTSTALGGRHSRSTTRNEHLSMGAVRTDTDYNKTMTGGRTESQERIVTIYGYGASAGRKPGPRFLHALNFLTSGAAEEQRKC
ncbi:hypothetical protein MGYG_04758 [Nannizzia gypsea CBS 118893]|uniref:Rhodopsin domain-containing protein n=1 Tax=Arthroderma gypseum (strain ATCC MYA-4604 / CBS 118893) TaxID=535722 RepID=E4UWK0_ARTGP|nr:hypothetical protein MGYG_04758 [Nannizzia gypsea CBS 118893]EFR01756.1 hypothetical protein MGYG_04758 [Nannizzia gypsea CBS 118893]